jgi:hypothetical protein
VAKLEYREHRISVSVIFDTPSQHQFTPVVEVRRDDSPDVLNTMLTHHVFVLQDRAIEFGFVLGREWIDKRLAEPSE